MNRYNAPIDYQPMLKAQAAAYYGMSFETLRAMPYKEWEPLRNQMLVQSHLSRRVPTCDCATCRDAGLAPKRPAWMDA